MRRKEGGLTLQHNLLAWQLLEVLDKLLLPGAVFLVWMHCLLGVGVLVAGSCRGRGRRQGAGGRRRWAGVLGLLTAPGSWRPGAGSAHARGAGPWSCPGAGRPSVNYQSEQVWTAGWVIRLVINGAFFFMAVRSNFTLSTHQAGCVFQSVWDKQWKSRRCCLDKFSLGRSRGKSD